MQRVLVAIDVNVEDTESALSLVSLLLRRVEWPLEVETVEVGEADGEEESCGC